MLVFLLVVSGDFRDRSRQAVAWGVMYTDLPMRHINRSVSGMAAIFVVCSSLTLLGALRAV